MQLTHTWLVAVVSAAAAAAVADAKQQDDLNKVNPIATDIFPFFSNSSRKFPAKLLSSLLAFAVSMQDGIQASAHSLADWCIHFALTLPLPLRGSCRFLPVSVCLC